VPGTPDAVWSPLGRRAFIRSGEGFTGVSVIDALGNIVGNMYNSHYLEALDSTE
jgi:hypothetical protein